ncbi:MAG: hypothetical protein ACW981_13740 [Candidatus Hodarchaeales archaeon]|jgi:hypothetical protein
MDSEKNQNFDLKISEHIESAVEHYFSHKKLAIDFSKSSHLNSFISDYFSLFQTLKKELHFKNLEDLLFEIVMVGLADIEKDFEKIEGGS